MLPKAFVTDIDGPVQDLSKVSRKYNLEDVYKSCKKNPYLLEEKFKGLEREVEQLKVNFVRKSDIKGGVKNTLRELKEIGYDNYAISDNVIFDSDKRVEIFMDKFNSNGEYLLDGVFCAKKLSIKDGKLKVEENRGGKKTFVEEIFSIYRKGILGVDDDNDIETALHIKNLKKELRLDVTEIKIGPNSIKDGRLSSKMVYLVFFVQENIDILLGKVWVK